ncbi:XRE family transcriptional regulator [Nocardia sp. NBC_00565]|uniref:helix-turn-helix domain-containing protein n=1 Tax=Nocardia sp. NBC_00565 TaxID=2975993 RepID=UPI002E8068BD|nr:XRE family transcriptional regulator [Nocardia sp. NBC_00565]WUC02419.1 XRE family transcriptional regulator [Nocardia sp. NBC_00565]
MAEKIFDIVWDAVTDTTRDVENMRLRSQLIFELTDRIAAQGWSREAAAEHLGVTAPRISDLLGGKTHLFSLDALVNMVAAAGMRVRVQIT